MVETTTLFSPYTLDSPYWLVLDGENTGEIVGPEWQPVHHKPGLVARRVEKHWNEEWQALFPDPQAIDTILLATAIAAQDLPSLQEMTLSLRPARELDLVARNLWIMKYLNEGSLACYMQRVRDRRHKHVGYEAFARMDGPDGKVIGGAEIMEASQALHLEYQVDRLMHRHAIESFVESDLDGFVFINFLTGFIHRPEVYLDGLNQAVDKHHLLPRSVALDVPLVDYERDINKLKSIANYCHARGFALSLDDVMTTDGLAALLHEIRPAFVKLDAKLAPLMLDSRRQGLVLEIIRLAHAVGASVLAEGVEDESLHATYLAADVDMFQGYLFGAPERCVPNTTKQVI